ncbi:LPXTG cell wall anchor domain-containing protein [Jiangella aurantiaca]|uniref:LPXTG cell wall anchor domain-containing protein n=1 Tax=Jiangella aurantiaca TaxID=2530373 RepID=A0A4R5ALZ6_9ACTN|nr:LPXTG cell wall anchor domain-containing protein [Jiangella aurantiaca]TDD72975.1 LPXTG cell wall anchor domain-containing protein [Jiangella aurantiaca]
MIDVTPTESPTAPPSDTPTETPTASPTEEPTAPPAHEPAAEAPAETSDVQEPGEVVLDATMEPQNVFAPPGSVAELEASVTNTGSADMEGGIVDFEVTEVVGDVTIVGIEGLELVDGTERPDEGCALVTPQRVECHTNETLAVGDTVTATFLVQLPGNVTETVVGDATLHVAGDNGGEDTVTSVLEVGPHDGYRFLVVTDPTSAEAAPGEVVDLTTTVANVGGEDVHGAGLDVDVPEGATIVGVDGQELVDGTERPDEGCALVTPRRLECHTEATLVAYDGYYVTTFQVRIDEDAEAGELGVVTARGVGDQGGKLTVDTAETVLTVTAGTGSDDGDDSGTDTGGAADGDDELPDTGTGRLPVLLAGAALLAAGGALLLHTRRP